MSKCVKCMKYFHPDYCIETVIREDNVIICLFCHLHKKELTVENKEGKLIKKVSKERANLDYLGYLKELSNKPSIAELIKEKGTR